MTDLPAPLTMPDCDLRDFPFLPLDVVRLRDSDLAATPDAEVFRAAVLAWCAAWHQVPAASLPDDDAAIARLIGMGRDLRGFRKLRAAGALHGFIKCSDGRLYHGVVAEKALTAWDAKHAQRDRTEKARQARLSQRLSQKENQSVTDDVTQSVTSSVVSVTDPSKGELRDRESKGKEEDTSLRSDTQRAVNPPRARKVRSEIEPDGFAEFYQAYPLHKARPAAAKAYGNALKRAPATALLDGARRYATARANEDPNFTKHPATWLNNDCWMDQEVSHETSIVRGRVRPASGQLTFVEAGASLIRELFADGGQAEGGNDNPAALEISRPLLSG